MRPAIPRLIWLVALAISAVRFRYHIRDLSQLLRTYGSFHTYLDDRPETLYRYPLIDYPDSSLNPVLRVSPDADSDRLVPRLFHRVHFAEDHDLTLDTYATAIESCRRLHPDWKHMVWTNDTAHSFMLEHYPLLYPIYAGYRYDTQRAALVRLAILDHYGGVYLDLEVSCRQSLEALRNAPFLTPAAHPVGIDNTFILSRPGHPFLKYLLREVSSHDLSWGLMKLQTMMTIGCGFLSNLWISFSLGGIVDPTTEGVYVLADEYGDPRPHMLRDAIDTPLFRYHEVRSYDWESRFMPLLGQYRALIFPAVLLASVFVACWWYWKAQAGASARRRRRNAEICGTTGDEECLVDKLPQVGEAK